MTNPIKATALALTLPGLLASSLPAAAAVGVDAQINVAHAGYGDHDWNDGDRDRWEHHDHGRHRGWDRDDRWRDRDDRWRDRAYYGDRYYGGDYYYPRYRERVYYNEPIYRNTYVWRGRDGRYYCRHRDGTTGLIVGGAVGALLGRSAAGYGDRTAGTVIGAAAGALLGHAIDRDDGRCR